MISQMNRAELEMEIIRNKSLYAMFDEARLMDGQYSDDELRAVIQQWIEACDECASCA